MNGAVKPKLNVLVCCRSCVKIGSSAATRISAGTGPSTTVKSERGMFRIRLLSRFASSMLDELLASINMTVDQRSSVGSSEAVCAAKRRVVFLFFSDFEGSGIGLLSEIKGKDRERRWLLQGN